MKTPDQIHSILDIEQFAHIVTQWHTNCIDTLKHTMSIPDGTEVTFNEETPQVLTGTLLKGFIMGIELCLMEMGKLPFYSDVDSQAN